MDELGDGLEDLEVDFEFVSCADSCQIVLKVLVRFM